MTHGHLDETLTGKEPGLARQDPDVRARRIAEIKRRIKDGTYRPPLLAVADELLNGGHLSFDHED